MSTASTILTRIEAQLKFDRSSIGVAGLEETHLLALINQAVLEYHNRFKRSGEPSSILQKEGGNDLIADTTLSAAVADGATTAALTDSSNYATSGAGAIWDDEMVDYVEFTGNSANTLSGVSGVDYDHESGDTFQILYALPSDFSDFRSTQASQSGVQVDGLEYFFTTGEPRGRQFTMYDNGTTKYLHFSRGLAGQYKVAYNKAPTTVDDTSDSVDVPLEDEWFVVWYVAEHAYDILGKQDRADRARERANIIMNGALMRRNIGKRPTLGRRIKRSYRDFPLIDLYNG